MTTIKFLLTFGFLINIVVLFVSTHYLVEWFNYRKTVEHPKNKKIQSLYVFLFITSLIWFIRDISVL